MFSYILQVTLCWSAFYLLYLALLRKETFFHVNRWYLLSTLILGLLIPFIEWQPSSVIEHHPTYEIAIEPIQFQIGQLEQSMQAASKSSILDWTDICLAVYLSGVLFFIALLLHGLWKIWKLYRKGEMETKGNLKIVYTRESHLPFSFFNCLFWSKNFEAELKEKTQILRHEEAHIHQWHTLDVLFLELLNILFWCSPIIYFYRKSLRATHEYLADALVLKDTKRKEYGHLLLKQSLSGIQIALANHFIHSQLKNRILMMTRNKSRKRNLMKYLPLLPILLLAILVFSKHDGRVQVEKAVAGLIETEKSFSEAKITDRLAELASTYAKFIDKDIEREDGFVKFTADYRALMETYSNSEREIAEITKVVFSQQDIAVDYTVDALTKITKIRFTNRKNTSSVFTVFFDDDFDVTDENVAALENRLYELAETYQRFGCCDVNPEAPHERFSSEYTDVLFGFTNSKQQIQIAKLTKEVFKEHHINVKLTVFDVDDNYVLEDISFSKEDLIRGEEDKTYTIQVNDRNQEVDTWEVTFTQFLKLHVKKYANATSEEERKIARSAFEAEQERWLETHPDKEERIAEIVKKVRKEYVNSLKQLDHTIFTPYYQKLLAARNVQQQVDAFQELANFMDDIYDENPDNPFLVINAAYKAAYFSLGKEELPIEFRLDDKKRILSYWMAGDVALNIYQYENNPRYLKTYEADFAIIHSLDASPNDEYRTVDFNIPKKYNKDWGSYVVERAVKKQTITEEDALFNSFIDGWDDRFDYGEDKVEIRFGSNFRVEKSKFSPKKVSPKFIHPIKVPSKVTKEVGYGMRKHPVFKNRRLHTGVDYVVPMNTEIIAAADGKVIVAGNQTTGFGRHITIEHKDGFSTFYAHLEKLLVKEGQEVKQGEVIALSGNTGISTGPHLHYEIRRDGKAIDFKKEGLATKTSETTNGIVKFASHHTAYDLKTIENRFEAVFQDPNLTLEERSKMLSDDYRLFVGDGMNDKKEEIENSLRRVVFMRDLSVEILGGKEVYLYKNAIENEIDEMPRFPSKDCEVLKAKEAKKTCSNTALVQYIYTNVKYPSTARKAGIDGMCLLKFKVMQDGSLDNIELLKDIGGGCGEEAKRVIEKMNTDNIRWIPGLKDGKKVAVDFTLPVKFKLSNESSIADVNTATQTDEVFNVVEQMPRFPSADCEALEGELKKRECAEDALLEYLFTNLKYPKAAKEAGVEGMSVVQFTVEKDGSLSDIKIKRDIGSGLGEESARVIHKMNKEEVRWIPGIQKGRTVRVRFTLPVKFKLSSDQKSNHEEKEFDPTPQLPSQKLKLTTFKVAPNPSNGNLRLQFVTTIAPVIVKIYDVNGKVLFEDQIQNFDGNYNQLIKIENSTGMHFLTVEQEGKVYTAKVLIE